MNANKIQKSAVYEVKVGKNTTAVKVVRIGRKVNETLSFLCGNVKTGKQMTVSDAAYKVLSEEERPMNARDTYQC
jgi:hypothetical protein